ncbi:MAG: Sfum_1244 family protein [Syntrophobacter sp.]
MDLSDLRRQVQKNCDISDARHAGVYSLCGLLLRMRDLYKWEHLMVPWQEPEPADLLGWVEDREQYWDKIAEEEIAPVTLGEERFDPYDMAGLNVRLRPLGLIYGAGYGIGLKPTFFLAECAGSSSVGGLRIDVVNRELARDIFMTPAMRQGDQIFARRSCMLFFLWDQILEARPSAREALEFALARYGVGLDEIRRNAARLGDLLERIAGRELETWVYHEIGEVLETGFDGGLWQEIVSAYANSPVEIFARVLKDVLADTHSEGLLGHIVQNRVESSLGFYVAFQRAISRMVFPEIREAFLRFRQTGDWSLIDAARESGRRNMYRHAATLARLHREAEGSGIDRAKVRIIKEILEPLGIVRGGGTENAEA